jgi:predicted dehydrogenase
MKAYLSPEDATYQSAQARAPGEPLNIKPEPVNIYRAEIEAFSQAILENRPFSIDGRAGLRNQRITDACYESARLGQAVKI